MFNIGMLGCGLFRTAYPINPDVATTILRTKSMAHNTYFPTFYFQVDIENFNNSLIRKTHKAIEFDNKWLRGGGVDGPNTISSEKSLFTF